MDKTLRIFGSAEPPSTWAECEFMPRTTEALRRLVESGYRIIVVTNQRGIARGRVPLREA
jgi:histidinol phosphatase-like enzyme